MSRRPSGMKQIASGVLLLNALTITGIEFSLSASHDAAPAVGYIEQLAGDLGAFSIERSGQTMSPALLLPVRAGDRLLVRGQANTVLLQCGNRRIRVTERESPFVVPAVPSPPGFLTRLGTLLLDLGNRLTTQQAKSMTKISTSSRGEEEPLAVPLLQNRTSLLPGDVTTLFLSWRGGMPPYYVRVWTSQIESREAAAVHDIRSTRSTILLSHPLSPGFVHIEVIDHEGIRAKGTIEIVSVESQPAIQPSFAETDIPPALHTVLTVDSWLKHSPLQWSFYAYQTIAPIAESFEPARLLRDCLESAVPCYDSQ
jgi:hypothetical protein